MVAFHQIPYSEVYDRCEKQFMIINELLKLDPSGKLIDRELVKKMLPKSNLNL